VEAQIYRAGGILGMLEPRGEVYCLLMQTEAELSGNGLPACADMGWYSRTVLSGRDVMLLRRWRCE
jgi:hypothetical protein